MLVQDQVHACNYCVIDTLRIDTFDMTYEEFDFVI